MLNYIWSGLIIVSFVFAVVRDSYDLAQNTYKNGKQWNVTVQFPENGNTEGKKSRRVTVSIPVSHSETESDSIRTTADYVSKSDDLRLVFTSIDELPAHWQKVAADQPSDEKQKLEATIITSDSNSLSKSHQANIKAGSQQQIEVLLPEVTYVSMRNIASAAFDMAEFAVQLAIGLIGAMALWLGLMKIAEESGLIKIFNRLVEPVLKYLFPDVPKDHPALSAISLNMAANVLGLSNAATPLGIKAMEELQKLNPTKEKASDAMCMFLAINTSSVQLLPPVTLVAIMGVAVNELMIGIIIATTFSTIIGISAAKWYRWRNRQQPSSELTN